MLGWSRTTEQQVIKWLSVQVVTWLSNYLNKQIDCSVVHNIMHCTGRLEYALEVKMRVSPPATTSEDIQRLGTTNHKNTYLILWLNPTTNQMKIAESIAN